MAGRRSRLFGRHVRRQAEGLPEASKLALDTLGVALEKSAAAIQTGPADPEKLQVAARLLECTRDGVGSRNI